MTNPTFSMPGNLWARRSLIARFNEMANTRGPRLVLPPAQCCPDDVTDPTFLEADGFPLPDSCLSVCLHVHLDSKTLSKRDSLQRDRK